MVLSTLPEPLETVIHLKTFFFVLKLLLQLVVTYSIM